jgi:hypothetical protein
MNPRLKYVKDLERGDVIVLKGDPYVDFYTDDSTATVLHVTPCHEYVISICFTDETVMALPNNHRVLVEE